MTDGHVDYTSIPENLRTIFESLENELLWIHGRWLMYQQLFGKSDRRVELLNESAPEFFFQMQRLWFDYVVLEICKITDPPTTKVKGEEKENLVIQQLQRKLDTTTEPGLASTLDELLAKLKVACEPLRSRRNLRIAHSDLNSVLAPNIDLTPGISRQSVTDALAAITEYVNAFRFHFLRSNLMFSHNPFANDATNLVNNLKRAAEYRELESEDEFGDNRFRLRVRKGKWRDA